MEDNRFEILLAAVERAREIHIAEQAAAAAVVNQPRPRRSASRRRIALPPRRREIAPPPPPQLPEAIKNAIALMAAERAATAPALVIQKSLYGTDVSSNHNRLSIPTSQIKVDFLTAEEKRFLEGGKARRNHLEVRIVEPSGAAVAEAKLSRWDMAKEGKRKSSCYVINGSWNEIVERNGLESDMVVQLWCFRIDGDVCFALVRLPPPPRPEMAA